MPKILSVAILIGLFAVLSQFARTSTGGFGSEAPEPSAGQQENQFRLKQSYPLGTQDHGLLATIYSCGAGESQKEVLSIWSRDSDAYELQYIKTAGSGETFTKPKIFSIEQRDFIKISTEDRHTGHTSTDALLSVRPDSTLHEVQHKQVKEAVARLSTRAR